MELHDQGKSLSQIAAMLNDRGIKPKRGQPWVHSSVLRIVKRLAKYPDQREKAPAWGLVGETWAGWCSAGGQADVRLV